MKENGEHTIGKQAEKKDVGYQISPPANLKFERRESLGQPIRDKQISYASQGEGDAQLRIVLPKQPCHSKPDYEPT